MYLCAYEQILFFFSKVKISNQVMINVRICFQRQVLFYVFFSVFCFQIEGHLNWAILDWYNIYVKE